MELFQILINGILLGGLYILYGTGLALTFGIMRTVNLAHGDMIVFASFMAMIASNLLGLGPFVGLILVIPGLFVIGFALQERVLNKTLDEGVMPAIITTFGLSILIQNGLVLTFSADRQILSLGGFEAVGFEIFDGFSVGLFPVLTLVCACLLLGGLHLFFTRTMTGRAFRATSDDPATAELVGIDAHKMYALSMGLAFITIAIAGVFMGVRNNFAPFDGPARLIYAFEAVIIGGLGSLRGTLYGGLILGVSQVAAGAIHPGLFQLGGHLVTLAALIFMPQGLFPETRDRK